LAGAAAGAAAAGAAEAPSASPLVMRPPRPVPSTASGETPLSARILDAAGEATAAAEAWTAGAAGAGAAAGCAAAAGAAAAALPSESIRAISSPEVTVLPSPLTISDNTPAAGAGTSSTTLSVSISIRISSAWTAAPGCFFPGQQCRLGHRLGQLGNNNVSDSHLIFPNKLNTGRCLTWSAQRS